MNLKKSNIRNLIKKILLEDSAIDLKSNRREKILFKKSFLDAYSGFKAMGSRGLNKPLEVRLGLKDSLSDLSSEDVKTKIENLGYNIERIIPRRGSGGQSDKYPTYVLRRTVDGDSRVASFTLVFGAANKGEKFEAELHRDPGPLLKALGINPDNFVSKEEALPARSRPLNRQIRNVGKEISDITINVRDVSTGEVVPVYVSIKDKQGGTFANNGYSGAFSEDSETGVVSVNSHPLDDFINALGLDKEKIAQGVTDYINAEVSSPELCSINQQGSFDADKVSQYLASAIGYGFVYAREHGSSFTVVPIESEEDAKRITGVPVKITHRYARYCGPGRNDNSKGTIANIVMDNGAEYSVAVRTKEKGKFRPTEIVSSIKKYPVDLDSMKRNISVVERNSAAAAKSEKSAPQESFGESVVRKIVRGVLSEELTRTDKNEIERISKKQAKKYFDDQIEKSIEKNLSKSLSGRQGKIAKHLDTQLQDKFKNVKNNKDFEDAVVTISKRVLKAMYNMHYTRKSLIDKMPVPKS
jgi:hypothetical protein